MQYKVLLPANYSPTGNYPVLLYLHQLDMGNYADGLLNEVNPWFNSVQFRTDHPSVVVMPLLDQSADQSGSTINWGGVSTQDSEGEKNALAALKQVMAKYSIDASRVYVTGNSMGGIGTEDMLIKYNAQTGTEGKIFTAGLALAGTDYGQGYPQPNASVVTGLKNVPFWAIHGGQDTQVQPIFDRNLFAAEQAAGGVMKYTQDDSLGHDVWDTYYTKTGSDSPLSWLFNQRLPGATSNPTQPPPPPPPPSPNNTVVMAGSTAAITDASGNRWTITADGKVAVNGTADASTASVKEIAFVNGVIWQENSANLWWSETAPNAGWGPAAGTATNPLPPVATTTPQPTIKPTAPPVSPNNTIVLAGSGGVITDTGGNRWSITADGKVAVNGVADGATANVIEIAYVKGAIWQENSAKLWWSTTTPTAGWSGGAGTAASPITIDPPPPPMPPSYSRSGTFVLAGSPNAIVDTAKNVWTITANGQVAVNGAADTGTSRVIELAYVGGKIWQQNADKTWWGKAGSTDPWSPGAGTTTSPLPPVASPDKTVIVAGSTTAITDKSGTTWSIDAAGRVAVNGTADKTTANVKTLAYVNGAIWQQNTAGLWWSKATTGAGWGPASGTSTAPIAGLVTASNTQASVTITPNNAMLAATGGDHMVFIKGSGDTVVLSGGKETITSSGNANTYVLPAAGSGYETFTSNILKTNDKLDLRTALAATDWNGDQATLGRYVQVSNTSAGAVIGLSFNAGGASTAIATINGANTTLSAVLAHAITA